MASLLVAKMVGLMDVQMDVCLGNKKGAVLVLALLMGGLTVVPSGTSGIPLVAL